MQHRFFFFCFKTTCRQSVDMIVKRSFDSPCCITFKSAFKHLHMSGSNADLVSLARHFARKYRFPFVPGRSHSQLYRIGTQTNSKFAARVSQAKATPFAPCFRENSRVYKIMIVNVRNERNRFSKKIEKKDHSGRASETRKVT